MPFLVQFKSNIISISKQEHADIVKQIYGKYVWSYTRRHKGIFYDKKDLLILRLKMGTYIDSIVESNTEDKCIFAPLFY